VHDRLEKATRVSLRAESVEIFHLLRVARNTHIHSGGRASQSLVNQRSKASPQAICAWEEITGAPYAQYAVGDRVHLGLLHLIGALAITKRLAEEANLALQPVLGRPQWVDILLGDWLAERKPGNRQQQLRLAAGLARRHYAPLQLTESELASGMQRAGV
jgi:hypothetical protein